MRERIWLLLVVISLWGQAADGAESQRGVVQVLDADQKSVLLYGHSHALLIGAGNYTAGWPKLANVATDIRQVRKALESIGFEVEIVEDPDYQELRQAFTSFINRYGYEVDNRLLFYFAGHGHTVKQAYGEDMGYIVPVDAPNPSVDRSAFLSKALDMQQIEVYAKRIQSKHALFLFDSCFSGAIFSLSRAIPTSISDRTAKPVRQFITSGSAEETVPDKSIFREQLVAALTGEGDTNKDGYVTGTELGEFLYNTVTNYSHGAQHPQYGKIRNPKLDKGDFVFPLVATSGAAAATVPSATPSEVKTETPPPPPVKFVGNVQVNVNTPAKVFLNEQPVGEARPDQALNYRNAPSGQVKIRVAASGFETQSKNVLVQRSQWTQVVFELVPVKKQASLTLRSNVYDDRVTVDGRHYGSTRLDLELGPGEHLVRVEKDGYVAFEQRVTLEAGEQRTLRAELRRVPGPGPLAPPHPGEQPARITLSSNVHGDRVYIDGQFRGTTRLDLELDPGPHLVVVEKEGYIPFEERIELGPGQQLTLRTELRRPGPRPGLIEELVHAWVQNGMHRNAGGLLALATLPFFVYGEVIHSEEQFLEVWQQRFERPGYPERVSILAIEPLEVPAPEAERVHPELGEAVHVLDLGNDSLFFRVRLSHERAREVEVVMIFRQTDPGLRIAGVCCGEVLQR